MKKFGEFISEESDAYNRAWEAAQKDFGHLKEKGYSQVAKDTSSSKPTRLGYESGALEKGNKTYRGRIHFTHDNFTRKHENIKSSWGHVRDEATPHSRPRVVTHEAEHKTIKDAVAHLEKLRKAQK